MPDIQKKYQAFFVILYLLFDGKPQILAEKYLKWEGDYLFERVSNPHANRILKKVAKKAGIKKDISYHYSRHTQTT